MLGEIYEELNQPDKAIENYKRFVWLWQDCDPELRPVVKEVERRIAQLQDKMIRK